MGCALGELIHNNSGKLSSAGIATNQPTKDPACADANR